MISYRHPLGVGLQELNGLLILTTPQGGKIAVDQKISALWQHAHAQRFQDISELSEFDDCTPLEIRCALACLTEAGLLERKFTGSQMTSEQNVHLSDETLVSVIVVGYNSLEWLEDCFSSLAAQTHKPLEIIFVDNGSNDESLSLVQDDFPQVRTERLDPSVSLSVAINTGVRLSKGESLLILNPDVKLEPDAVSQMVRVLSTDQKIGAVAAKLKFLWAPNFLNGLGNRVGPFSWGTDNALGHLDLGQFDNWGELPSACFAATLIPRIVWNAVGPVDEDFPMYYEDSEWSYRARLLGYKVWAAPQAVIYHAFGGRVPNGHNSGLSPFKLRNVVYGRYRFVFKIVGEYFFRFIRNYWLEDWANFTRLLLQRDLKSVQAYLGAWLDILSQLPKLRLTRKNLQSKRVITSDEELFLPQKNMPMTNVRNGLPELTWNLITTHYLQLIKRGETRSMPELDAKNRKPHLLIVSHDVVNQNMAGPGMRYFEMARALKDEIDVTLAIPNELNLKIAGMYIVRYSEVQPGSLQILVENCDIALISGYMIDKFPFLQTSKTRLVVDLYDPMVLENLHYYIDEPLESQQAINYHAVDIMNRLVKIGDFFICGNERQRDFWLGVLAANGRINPKTFQQDSSLQTLVDVVGIGFPVQRPRHKKNIVRGIHPQIPLDARIVLWGGGIWNWLDPITLVQSWPKVIKKYPNARLVFLGTRHPNPLVPVHEIVQKTISLAEQIGEKDKTIVFIEWVSYEDRESLLLEADIGVALHPVHIETRYSARTRILDYLWAGLPVLVTEGDVTSEWVQEFGLGRVAPESDPNGVAQALIEILDHEKTDFKPAFKPLLQKFSWSAVVQPLLSYCLQGGYAPDRNERLVISQSPPVEKYSRIGRAKYIWHSEGTKALLHRIWRYIQWRLSRS